MNFLIDIAYVGWKLAPTQLKKKKPSCVISSVSVMLSIKHSEFQHSCVYRVMIRHVSCITKTLWLFKVRKHISGSPTLSKSLCGRSPVAVIELSNSIGKRTEIVLLSRCMDWVNAFKTWSSPAIILIACLSEVMKVFLPLYINIYPPYVHHQQYHESHDHLALMCAFY